MIDEKLAVQVCSGSSPGLLHGLRSKHTAPFTQVTSMQPKNLTLECSRQKHPFHILDSSPFPFLVSLFLFTLLVPVTFYFHGVELVAGLPRADMIHIGFLGLYLTAMS